MTTSVLLAFLDKPVREDYAAAFHRSGYQIDLAMNRDMALSMVAPLRCDAAILVGSPSEFVVTLLALLAGQPRPIICVMSADDADEIALLDRGATLLLADDSDGELIRAWTGKLLSLAAPRRSSNFHLDMVARRACFGGIALQLRPLAFDILFHLTLHAGQPLDSAALQRRLWPQREPSAQRLAVHMHNLRSALAAVGADTHLRQVPGFGYALFDSAPGPTRRRPVTAI